MLWITGTYIQWTFTKLPFPQFHSYGLRWLGYGKRHIPTISNNGVKIRISWLWNKILNQSWLIFCSHIEHPTTLLTIILKSLISKYQHSIIPPCTCCPLVSEVDRQHQPHWSWSVYKGYGKKIFFHHKIMQDVTSIILIYSAQLIYFCKGQLFLVRWVLRC